MAELELETMASVLAAMERLDHDAQLRVIKWTTERLRLGSVGGGDTITSSSPTRQQTNIGESAADRFKDFAGLFHSAGPTTDVEKALVASYWMQVCRGNPDFASQSLNSELKHLGHPVGNITRALAALIRIRPSLVQQLRKDGGSRQARKTYRLTTVGQKRVEQMCSATATLN